MSEADKDIERTKRRGGVPGLVRRAVPLAVVGAAAAAVWAVWRFYPRSAQEMPPREVAPVRVVLETVAPVAELADTFDLPGVVEPYRVVDVAAEVEARIVRFAERDGRALAEGDLVRKGEPLAYLDKDLLQAEFDRAKAQMSYDTSEYERVSELRQRNVATDNELDQARTKMAVSRALYEAARTRLERTTIYAPISGTLDDIAVEVGEYMQVGKTVARIVDLEKIKVALDVSERDVPYLSVGAEEQVLADVKGESIRLSGPVTYISELADASTRTSRVEITLEHSRKVLRAGQIVRARMTRRVLRDVIMIPLAAVIPLENGRAVYVANSGLAQRRDVTLGIIRGQRVQVLSGLEGGERLIVEGHRFVGPGQRVEEGAQATGASATAPATSPHGRVAIGQAEGEAQEAGQVAP